MAQTGDPTLEHRPMAFHPVGVGDFPHILARTVGYRFVRLEDSHIG